MHGTIHGAVNKMTTAREKKKKKMWEMRMGLRMATAL